MNWIRLQERRLLPTRDPGMTGRAILAMMACRFNIPETFLLPASAYGRVLAGTGTVPGARQALGKYDFHTDIPSFTRLIEALGSDIAIRCSPVVPRTWLWLDPEGFDTPTVCHGMGELQEAVRGAWLKLLDADIVRQAHDAGIPETSYLRAISMAVLAQRAELYPGLAGRTWSPDPGLAEPNALVQCRLGASDPEAAAWAWTVTANGKILDRPGSLPVDERPIMQSARLAAVLARRMGKPCTLDWVWDGQELMFLSALPVAPHIGIRAFTCRPMDRLVPRPLSPMAADIVVRLLHDVVEDAGTLLLGKRLPAVPPDVAMASLGRVYIDSRYVQTLFQQVGLPPESLNGLLLQQELGTMKVSPAVVHLARAALAVRLAVPRLERWVSDNRDQLTALDLVDVDTATVGETLDLVQQLLTLVRPLALDLLLLLVSSSLRSDGLRRALAHRHLDQHLGEALEAANDTAGLDPWAHLDRIAANISDQTARLATDALSAGSPEQAMQILGSDVTVLRDIEAFMRSFAFFRTAVIDVGSPTLRERADLLPVALLRAWETGAAARVEAAHDPIAWLSTLSGDNDLLLRKRYQAVIRTSATTEKAWFYLAKSLSRARILLLHAGDLLVEQGQLDRRDEIMLLSREELTQGRNLRETVSQRAVLQSDAPTPEVIIVREPLHQEAPQMSPPPLASAG
ncbi:MAG: hypothetical protein ABFD13_05645 [Candidatus Cryosericum sp.]|nr:hypothetical protein [bacterium]